MLSQPLTQTKEIDLDDFIFGSQSPTTNSSHTEFDLYTKEQEIDRTDCPLNWWKSNSKKYPVISKIAMKYLCIQGTSVPSERMFSAAGHITSDRRSRLTPDNADTLLFLNKNMNWV
ncbi:unnamed protein product [Didymodactylos carnosus]|uniref:HAT C-terminal dimerisation domain-containing protein n=1 Tax=Didymodactylos carnosus TaxID=1234261 RepID=A0A8S2IKN6_9BILA|nr:unnamed protein product [Didymodactylos carnosus]CAF3755309.1 unnamed protein product [Didymodactylos carnosus]